MQNQIAIGYKQIVNLAYLLPDEDKKKLIIELQSALNNKDERKLGKYDGQIRISDDFDEPLEDFKEYMQ